MFKITDTNYKLYQKVLALVRPFMFGDSPSSTNPIAPPIDVEEWEKANMPMIKKGIKEALIDMLSWIKLELKENDKILLDKKLVDEGLPGLWKLMAVVNNIPAKVLKRGKINNLDEWYVITETLSAVDSPVTQDERIKLGELSNEFEDRQRKMGR